LDELLARSTERIVQFCIDSTSDGRAILAPEWVELCARQVVAHGHVELSNARVSRGARDESSDWCS
jgi:hypothetical protein